MAGNPREVALQCLQAGERQGAWPDGYLRNAMRKAALDNRDAGLCSRLTFGVLQNRMLLDWYIGQFSSVPVDKLEPAVRNSLRLGFYQLIFLDRVPVHAIVNESVLLVKRYSRNPRASGLVNAVLRAFERSPKEKRPQPESLSIQYSHPDWLVDEFLRVLTENEVPDLLKANNEQPPVYAQVNTCRYTEAQVLEALAKEGINAQPHSWLPGCLVLSGTGNLEKIEAFRSGAFYIQDPAARLAILAAGPQPGMTVLDACGAPGGKAFAAAIAMEGRGDVLSCDIHPHKEKLIQSGAERLGLSCIHTAVMNGKEFDPAMEKRFDLVIADVPCSGLGIIRKKPDIRYKDPDLLKGLPQIQKDILKNVARYVKPGGIILYATCTVLSRENQNVVWDFLREEKEYSCEAFDVPGVGKVPDGMLTLWPHIHGTDGFFFAKLRRV